MEHRNFQDGRIVKRRLMMEAQSKAQVRRLHIIYFLSRNGHNEHPHLIRIHHLSKNGVRLRDIKRWLGELRGKHMPESFAWSYKRTYKRGYVWQDLLDDDLVTPISDNEYVLKGSDISSTNHNSDFSRIPTHKDMKTASSKEIERNIIRSSESFGSSKTPSTDSSQSFGSETSTLTDHSVEKVSYQQEVALNEKKKNDNKRKTNKLEIINAKTTSSSSSKTADTSDNRPPHHRKSHSSAIFRNFISCGGIDTHDSVVNTTSKRYKPFLRTCSSNSADGVRDSAKEKKGGCSQPRAASSWPLYGPHCSQCGKTFKPEKLQSHMNSCKGMKALTKASNSAISASQNVSKLSTASSRNKDSVSAYLLTQNC